MLFNRKTDEPYPKIWNKDQRYAKMLAKRNPEQYVIGVEVPTAKPVKEEAKAVEPQTESVKEEAPKAPKKRGRRPAAK